MSFHHEQVLIGTGFRHHALSVIACLPCCESGALSGRFAHAPVAQRLEQGTHNPLVLGSNPGGSTLFSMRYDEFAELVVVASVNHRSIIFE